MMHALELQTEPCAGEIPTNRVTAYVSVLL
jgi:hypothetical protein